MQTATIGHNNPPDPLDDAIAPFSDTISEAENWLDGTPVESEGQMKAVDDLIKGIKAARKSVDAARDDATKPLHAAWQAEIARWKPTQDDLDRIVKGLLAAVDGFKRKLAAEKEEARRAAERAAWEATRKAQEAAQSAQAADIEAQRQAAQAKAKAEAAQAAAKSLAQDTVKGLRTVQRYEITDMRAALHWIARNDKDAMAAFIESYVAKHYKTAQIDGVSVTTTKEAF